jgi:hypothetical protein
MRNQLVAANSANQAQAILGAWTSGNIELFREQLNRIDECAAAEAVDSDEIERMELLRAIAADLRGPSLQPAAADPANVYGNLLRHLASTRKRTRTARSEQLFLVQ